LSTFSNQFPKKAVLALCCDKCNKQYKDKSGLWRHKKTCKNENNEKNEKNDIIPQNQFTSEMLIKIIEQNKELQNALIEQNNKLQQSLIEQNQKIVDLAEKTKTTNMNCGNFNNNKTFNLQFFLNETCKNAMNISDFVSSIQVDLDELENTGRHGYVEGISNIIIKRLNNLEEHFRPIHCSDTKREVFYIKDNNEWLKEKEEKPILTKAIKVIANENIKQIKNWQEKYPDCMQYDSNKNNLYLKIVSNSMNGLTKEEGDKNIEKIISNVAKETIILK
jgi:hypothetical protein